MGKTTIRKSVAVVPVHTLFWRRVTFLFMFEKTKFTSIASTSAKIFTYHISFMPHCHYHMLVKSVFIPSCEFTQMTFDFLILVTLCFMFPFFFWSCKFHITKLALDLCTFCLSLVYRSFMLTQLHTTRTYKSTTITFLLWFCFMVVCSMVFKNLFIFTSETLIITFECGWFLVFC